MNFRHAIVMMFALTTSPYLGACSLEAAMSTCAQCGEIRSIAPRPLRADIRLVTDAPLPDVEALDRAGLPMVYDVRIHMDRGGSRDFVLAERPRLKVGERVQVREGLIVPLVGSLFHDWT
jgi:hypothetical protein